MPDAAAQLTGFPPAAGERQQQQPQTLPAKTATDGTAVRRLASVCGGMPTIRAQSPLFAQRPSASWDGFGWDFQALVRQVGIAECPSVPGRTPGRSVRLINAPHRLSH